MNKKIILLPIFGLIAAFSPLVFINEKQVVDNPVLISTKDNNGPVFYSAGYSSEIINEPYFNTQKSYSFDSMNYDAHIGDKYTGESVKVAVIDSGINYTHEDFKNNGNYYIQSKSRSIEYTTVNETLGWYYFQFNSGSTHLADSLGHGTNVASAIASQINGLGCAGIAPHVDLYVYKVTDSEYRYQWEAIKNALQYCIDEGVDVINMSFQSYEHAVSYNSASMEASSGCSSVLSYMINKCYNAGITLVAAAGNFNTSEPSYPASNDHVISVGSLAESSTTTKAGYSNLSGIDIVAPGTIYCANNGSNSSYRKNSGTSFSSPIVTAAIALYIEKHPSATPSQIEQALYDSCDSIPNNPSWAGNGRLNLARFLDLEDKPTSITFNNVTDGEIELEAGQSFDIDYTVGGVGNYSSDVTFELYNDDGTISIDENGRITALKEGEEDIFITCNDDYSVSETIHVTVNPSSNPELTVTPSSFSLEEGFTQQLSITTSPNNSFTCSSNNTNVATVSSAGLVTAISEGSATITVNGNGLVRTVSVNVTKSPLTSISVTGATTEYVKGTTFSFDGTCTATYHNGHQKNVTPTSVSSPDMTTTGNKTVTVTYSEGGVTKSVTYQITVSEVTSTIVINRTSFTASGSYAWYDWTSSGVSGKGEIYAGNTNAMQMNKGSGSKTAAMFNTTPVPGFITSISAKASSTTYRDFNAYVSSSPYSLNGTSMTLGNNVTQLGNTMTVNESQNEFGSSTSEYSYFCVQENVSNAAYVDNFTITYIPKTLLSVSVKTAPNKTTYIEDEVFDPTGLVLTATYEGGVTKDITYSNNDSNFTFSPSLSTKLAASNKSVTITYCGKTCNQAITVTEKVKLSSISLSGQKTSFVEGDEFDFGGTVTATFSDSSETNVTSSATFTGYNMSEVGEQTVTASYEYDGITKTSSYQITISKGTLSSISVSGQTTNFVKNGTFSFDGTVTATFANGYQKSVTPTSISSPDMTSVGEKTVTITYTYNGVSKSTSYEISVTSYRVVMEVQEYSEIYDCSSGSIVKSGTITDAQDATISGSTGVGEGGIKLASGSSSGSITVSTSNSKINKVDVYAKQYKSSEKTITIDGHSTTVSSEYECYSYSVNLKTSITISCAKENRAYVQKIIIYTHGEEVDIGHSDDCVGLENFINTYMHMDYTENLGYCKDSEHHYYSSAKEAFNGLNDHQRKLFTQNSAYSLEWNRLSTWASFNNDSLDENNTLGTIAITNQISGNTNVMVVVISSLIAISLISGFAIIKKKKTSNK